MGCVNGDGNGWAAGPGGGKKWGLFGAAGLLLVAGTGSNRKVLMQHRAQWTAAGGTWGLPGGARDSHESCCQAALREAREETSIDTDRVTIVDQVVTSGPFAADPARPDLPGGWTYTVVIAHCDQPLPAQGNDESLELRWVLLEEVASLPLMPAFAASWERLKMQISKGNAV